MRRRLVMVGLFAGLLLMPSWSAAAQAGAAQEKKPGAKEQRVSGTVRLLDKTAKTFTVQQRNRIERQVIYSDTTKFTVRNKPGSVDDLKEGVRVIVLGTANEKKQVVARRLDVRNAL